MTIHIRATGMDMTPAVNQYVEEKFTMLEKYSPNILNIDVQVGMETHHHNKGKIYQCSATVQIPGDVLKVERNAEDLYKAIDKVKDHLRETLAQHKERQVDGRKGE